MYNWQQNDWPHFRYDIKNLEVQLYAFVEKTGHLRGALKTIPKDDYLQATIDILVSEALKTSEIEGDYLSRTDVMSSIKKNLGLKPDTDSIKDANAKGIADLVIDVQDSYDNTLTEEKLFAWHRMLFPEATTMNVGQWRTHTSPMQVVSGRVDRPTIHFEAPPSKQVPLEMNNFIKWFNDTSPKGAKTIIHAPIRSAISHLYFESIHPFEDGNGRIGRAIAEKALSQTVGFPLLLSLSAIIEANKSEYYSALKEGQRSNAVTAWITYFTNVILLALDASENLIDFTIRKVRLFDNYGEVLNDRQIKVIKRMFQEGPQGFKGGMTAKKYMRITKTSKPTATRDLQKLVRLGIFRAAGAGRSTSYSIAL